MKDLKDMKRVPLKLSGEALAGDKKTGFDEATCADAARQVKTLVDEGLQVAIVIGGGNFWRGRTSESMERTKADQIGMLATVMNCIYVSDAFSELLGMKTEVFTPFVVWSIYRRYSQKTKHLKALNEGKVVFLCGRNRASLFFNRYSVQHFVRLRLKQMLSCLAKAIDGVYDSDPADESGCSEIR